MSEMCTVSEVARRFGKSPDTIRSWADAGKLPAVRTETGVRLFRREDVERLMTAMRGLAPAAA